MIRQYTSLGTDKKTLLGALQVEWDLPVCQFALPTGNDTLRVWGISLQEIKNASTYNGKLMTVYAGMAPGLPLANTQPPAGIIMEGVINQCFGNWQGTDMTLDFVIVYGIGGTPELPKNIVLNWKKGIPLGAAIQNTLAVAAPGTKCTVTVNPNLILGQDEPGFYENMSQFTEYLNRVSRHIIGGKYPGVNITYRGGQFFVFDNSSPSAPKSILFTDLIGQPAWLGPNEIQFKTVMRSDINVSDYVKLPPGQVTTAAQSQSQFRDGAIINGNFQIDQVRHIGSFRQPDGASWVTVFNGHPT